MEPDYSAEQRQPLEMDTNQNELASSRTESGYRRMRGPAGSGKSLVLAARAAKLAGEGKDVLAITYNITLLHYLRDLCARVNEGHPNQISWINFHQFCRRLAHELDLSGPYTDTWRSHFEHGTDAFHELSRMLERHIMSEECLSPPLFDAILVDEGQDFDPQWWRLLRLLIRPGGEMLLIADATQDVYGTARRWIDTAMVGAGLRGPWSELPVSYRLPPALLQIAGEFAETFLPADLRICPKAPPVQMELDLAPCTLRWVQVHQEHGPQRSVEELMRLITTDDAASRAMTDLTLLVDNITDGNAIGHILRGNGVSTVDTFAYDPSDRGEDRRKKLAFWKGAARVKVTTLHSFKGWEGRLLVIWISRARSIKDFTLLYTGLTRLKKHSDGSFLTVVCAEPRLKDFGAKWLTFVDRTCETTDNARP